MEKLNHFTIDVALAASIVDATLFQARHPEYASLSQILGHLREGDVTIVDLDRSLTPVLIDIAGQCPLTMMRRVQVSLEDPSLGEEAREHRLRSEIAAADLRRIAAIRILGLVRDPQAESLLKKMVLDGAESLCLRVTALRALIYADEKKCLAVAQELLSRPVKRLGVIWRMTLMGNPVEIECGRSAEEPELLLRECLEILGGLEGERARLLIMHVLQDRNMPLTLRQFAFDVIHSAGPGAPVETLGILKVVSYLK